VQIGSQATLRVDGSGYRAGGLPRRSVQALALAVVYVIVGRLGLAIEPVHLFASLVWAPTGIALAVLLRGGLQYWPGVALGGFVVNAWAGAPVAVALAIAAGNTLEAVAGAYLIRRVSGPAWSLERLRDVLPFVVLGALLSTTISASVGVSTLFAAGLAPRPDFIDTWRAWWLGDVVGALVVGSLLLAWSAPRRRVEHRTWGQGRRAEAAALGVVLIAADLFVFHQPPVAAPTGFLQACMLIPLFMWAAVRFEMRGATAAVFLSCAIAVAGTASGLGPFVQESVASSLLHQQAFMAIVGVAVLIVGAVTSERADALRRCNQSEHTVRKAQDELRLITDVTPWMLTRCGRDLRYRFVNRAYAQMVGHAPEQIAGRPIAEVLGAQAYETIRPHIEAVLQGHTVEYEDDLHLENGTRSVHVVYVPERNDRGDVIGWLASIVDVTERKRAEDALREADRRKSEFLSVLSHELRNPLAPIRNSVHLLERAAGGNEQATRATAVIERQTRQLTRLVDDLLDVTRISRGLIQLQRERVELTAIVRHAVEDHGALFSSRNVSLHLRVDVEPQWMEADAARVSQIVGNLLHNAAKFTRARGHVTVSVGQEEGRAVICVADDGDGIAPELLPHVFEPFTQADESLHRTQGGLGLGLALAKGLVERHGGDIDVRSDGPGRGSEFRVRFPVLGDVALAPEETSTSAPEIARRRVLVIEDNLDAAETLKEGLAMCGHEVVVAHDGLEGVAFARSFRPDVVLCDIGLPGFDGYEVARRIRADPSFSPLLVAVTGYALPEDQRKAREAGFDRHLAKPFQFRDIENVIAIARAGGAPRES
jgi:PAS domain S-box-containing protein